MGAYFLSANLSARVAAPSECPTEGDVIRRTGRGGWRHRDPGGLIPLSSPKSLSFRVRRGSRRGGVAVEGSSGASGRGGDISRQPLARPTRLCVNGVVDHASSVGRLGPGEDRWCPPDTSGPVHERRVSSPQDSFESVWPFSTQGVGAQRRQYVARKVKGRDPLPERRRLSPCAWTGREGAVGRRNTRVPFEERGEVDLLRRRAVREWFVVEAALQEDLNRGEGGGGRRGEGGGGGGRGGARGAGGAGAGGTRRAEGRGGRWGGRWRGRGCRGWRGWRGCHSRRGLGVIDRVPPAYVSMKRLHFLNDLLDLQAPGSLWNKRWKGRVCLTWPQCPFSQHRGTSDF